MTSGVRAVRDTKIVTAALEGLSGAGAKLGNAFAGWAKGAGRSSLWTSTRTGTSVSNAFRHFKDHGADFGARNAVDYTKQAQAFLRSPPSGTLSRVRSNGDVVRYNPGSNTFGVMDSAGAPRTFFRPDPSVHGYPSNLDYFNAQ